MGPVNLFHPSVWTCEHVLLKPVLLVIRSLVFFWNWHNDTSELKEKLIWTEFREKLFHSLEVGKMDPKWTNNYVFFLRLFSFSWKISKMKYTVIYISPQIPCLVKFWFLSYGPKCSQPVRLQNSFKYIISRKNWGIKPM